MGALESDIPLKWDVGREISLLQGNLISRTRYGERNYNETHWGKWITRAKLVLIESLICAPIVVLGLVRQFLPTR